MWFVSKISVISVLLIKNTLPPFPMVLFPMDVDATEILCLFTIVDSVGSINLGF